MTSTEEQRKSVLITGCSPGGIGNSLAREFHRNGLRVFATARDAKSLEDLAALGIETLSLTVDDENSVRTCHAEVERRLADNGLDYLADLSEARATFETNFIAVICMCKTFLPLLIKAKGTIVQIGSVAGVIPYVFGSVYNASKAALHSFSDSLRVELAPFGVHVTTVITGGVQSRIARDEYHRRVVHSQDGAMPHATYARSVVDQVLYGSAPWRWFWPWAKGRKSWIWEGNKSWLVWFLTGGWAWTGLFHYAMTKMFKLHKLSQAVGK
ncbi:short chain dehydrogenase/reductase [Aspergillus steynii IBT 23096]|uniref:Short chain dehydrogenase/reductase n=1 Tax=Aspergillus steynii IBT 23096 TaxID=1392250 RepID=A0A2I2GCD9_9EURO|nr:short chain dehydrogenase/reductase [Aspergillus steynii IBT 23096]PLB50543.1 short chain dehydrogenase/reductase [Aspergillus steynii IBT 23096]